MVSKCSYLNKLKDKTNIKSKRQNHSKGQQNHFTHVEKKANTTGVTMEATLEQMQTELRLEKNMSLPSERIRDAITMHAGSQKGHTCIFCLILKSILLHNSY